MLCFNITSKKIASLSICSNCRQSWHQTLEKYSLNNAECTITWVLIRVNTFNIIVCTQIWRKYTNRTYTVIIVCFIIRTTPVHKCVISKRISFGPRSVYIKYTTQSNGPNKDIVKSGHKQIPVSGEKDHMAVVSENTQWEWQLKND